MIELGRPSKMGIIKFGASDGTYSVEKNFEEHIVDKNGDVVDLRLPAGAVGFLMQFRSSDTATFRYSTKKGEVTDTDGGYWTSRVGQPDGETGISVDAQGTDKLNIYVASSDASETLEIRVWHGFG